MIDLPNWTLLYSNLDLTLPSRTIASELATESVNLSTFIYLKNSSFYPVRETFMQVCIGIKSYLNHLVRVDVGVGCTV